MRVCHNQRVTCTLDTPLPFSFLFADLLVLLPNCPHTKQSSAICGLKVTELCRIFSEFKRITNLGFEFCREAEYSARKFDFFKAEHSARISPASSRRKPRLSYPGPASRGGSGQGDARAALHGEPRWLGYPARRPPAEDVARAPSQGPAVD